MKLAIVGRPNVGKSALFNSICKKRISIVDEQEGVTRDRLYANADFFGRPIEVIDTGGINPHAEIPFYEEVRRQTEIAMEEADVLVMVVDAQTGVTPLDEDIARLLRKTSKPICLAVNKIDNRYQLDLVNQFYSLGIGQVVAVSATQNFQIAELLEGAFKGQTLERFEKSKDDSLKVAIVGRPNVGKSTLMNYLLDEERCVVSPIPGTTRDSIDVMVEVEGQRITFIDTAGIRRKAKEHEAVDKFAAIRTQGAIERADICVLMIDAERGMTTQDKRIAQMIDEAGKGCILIFNKWDLVSGYRMEHCLKSLRIDVSFLNHCPAIFVSATEGRNVKKLFPLLCKVRQAQLQRITTGQLNKFIEKALQTYHPPMLKGKRMRIYYLAQVEINPPHFVLFVNNPDLMVESYKKYLIHSFRETYGFEGVPITFGLKGRIGRETKATSESQI